MLELLLEVSLNKINTTESIFNLGAGIVYNKNHCPIKKILFKKKDNLGFNVFNDESYSLEEDEFYIGDIVYIDSMVKSFLKKYQLNLKDLLMVYQMFLNDETFINSHLNFFGMEEVEVGYKGKKEIWPKAHGLCESSVSQYNGLKKIINYKDNEIRCKLK